MNRSFRKKWIKVLAVAISLCLMLTALTVLFGGLWEKLPQPFLHLFSSVSQTIDKGKAYFEGKERLQAENKALREEVGALRRASGQAELAVAENERLRRLLDFTQEQPKLKLLPAWVVGRVPNVWQSAVHLDKGEADGITVGQCVIDEGGALVGRITQTGAHGSELSLLCDPAFQLAGQGSRSEVLGLLEGSLEGMPKDEVSFTGLHGEVALGEQIVTFAEGESYPSGLVVGAVTAVTEEPGGLTKIFHVTPTAALDRLGQVFVVTAFGA